jgi:uncharacterized protein (TIGR03083 family)
MLRTPEPILIADLFEPLLVSLIELLESLTPDEWATPNVCGEWSLHDLALHLLGGDIGILSRQRDGYRLPDRPVDGWDDLVAFIDGLNDQWVTATRRISPRLLTALLRWTGTETAAYLRSKDPYALGDAVSWAGPAPAPVWLDLAREYTERWHHQQQMRTATSRPRIDDPRFFSPVLDAFVRALPRTFQDVVAPTGTTVVLAIDGAAGSSWTVRRDAEAWSLWVGADDTPTTTVHLPQDVAWRVFTKDLSSDDATPHATITGDPNLGVQVLHMVSVIA